MPLKYLTTQSKENIALNNIDIINDADKFGVSPATLQYIIEHQASRGDVLGLEVTASQIGKGVRQMYLEDVTEYATTPQKLIAGTMGTIKHSIINVGGPNIFSETRYKSTNGHLSAKYDNMCLVHKDNKTVDLYDLKAIGWFKVKQIVEKGIWAEGKDYGFQLNLQAVLIEQNTEYKVERLFLEFVPRDLDVRKRAEAEKMGYSDPGVILYEVPRLSSDAVLATYETLYADRVWAHSRDYAPICDAEQRWVNAKTGISRRCVDYCPVLAECKAMCKAHNEIHPTDDTHADKVAKVLEFAKPKTKKDKEPTGYNKEQWKDSVAAEAKKKLT